MGDYAIKLDGVCKYYKLYEKNSDRLKEALHPFGRKYHRKFYALQDVDIKIKRGEIVGVIGKNGSGKSTLLKIISKVLVASSGSVYVNGKVSALLELGAGFNPEFTGLENIYFYSSVLGFSKNEMDSKLEDILSFAEIGEFINQPLKTYSSGMKARLGFATAIHVNPEILILDEVLAVGDALFRRKCFSKIGELFESGKTIIYVGHNIDSIKKLCTRAIFLDNGRVMCDGDTRSVAAEYHKFLFSKESQGEVRPESGRDGREYVGSARKEVDINRHDDEIEGLWNIYDCSLVPESRDEYRNAEVFIDSCGIETVEGVAVNVLRIGEEYRVNAKIRFEDDFNNVKFGCLIKDEKGVIITGMTQPGKSDYVPHARCHDSYDVTMIFCCKFSPGHYYIDFGVATEANGVNDYLVMVHDIAVMKVLDEGFSFWGQVDLWVDGSVRRISA